MISKLRSPFVFYLHIKISLLRILFTFLSQQPPLQVVVADLEEHKLTIYMGMTVSKKHRRRFSYSENS